MKHSPPAPGKDNVSPGAPGSVPHLPGLQLAEGQWSVCPECGRLVFKKELADNLEVCPRCDFHLPVTAARKLEMLVDPGSFVPDATRLVPCDPLCFVDSMPYVERLSDASSKCDLDDAVVFGTATIGSIPVAVAVMEFLFMGGSMGSVVGEAVARTARTAAGRDMPLVIVCASGGARMQEGLYSLLQMVKTSAEIGRLEERGLPYVAVLTHPTTGGVAASFATLADVIIAEKGALIGFAGPRVIEQTIRRPLPHGFQSAEFCLERGMVDRVFRRSEVAGLVSGILTYLTSKKEKHEFAGGEAEPPRFGPAHTEERKAPAPVDDAWKVVETARHEMRPRLLYYAEHTFTGFIELHGDRLSGDDQAVIGGFARLKGIPVMLIGHNRGLGPGYPAGRRYANNGMPHPEGIRKSLRLARLAEKFELPVITMVDTPGAYPGIEAEERGQALAISQMICTMTLLRVPVLSVVTGEGGSGGALSLAVADRVLMLKNSTFSVISPEGCAAILWRDSARTVEAASVMKMTAGELADMGLIDGIVAEPDAGAHEDPGGVARLLEESLAMHLASLMSRNPNDLVEERYMKYASIGVYEERREPK